MPSMYLVETTGESEYQGVWTGKGEKHGGLDWASAALLLSFQMLAKQLASDSQSVRFPAPRPPAQHAHDIEIYALF